MAFETVQISRQRIRLGIKIFAVLTLAGIIGILHYSSFTASAHYLLNFKLHFLLLGFCLTVFDCLISGLRIYLFARHIQSHISYPACIQASLANIFVGGATPSQTGGGAGQIYILYKEGMRIVDAAVVSFLGFLNTVIILSAVGILVTIFVHPEYGGTALKIVSRTTISIFSLILLTTVFSMISPEKCKKNIYYLAKFIPFFRSRIINSTTMARFFDSFMRYSELMKVFIKDGKLLLTVGFIITAVIYFNKFVIAYIVLAGLGVNASFWEVIYLQLLLILIFYFSPTPGASGVAEVSTAIVMKQIIPESCEGAFVILWRFFTLYASMLAGGIVLMRYFTKNGKR